MFKLARNKVFKNAAWLIGCKIAQMVINLFVGMLTARYLGPSNYGIINYAASIVAFAVPLMQLGMSNILVQEIVNHKQKEGEILGTAITMSFFSSLLCIAGIFCFVSIVNAGEKETIIEFRVSIPSIENVACTLCIFHQTAIYCFVIVNTERR